MRDSFLDGRVIVTVGDITLEKTDAIVNAANCTLLGGGGVDGAIHARGGPQILAECEAIRADQYPEGLPTGKAVITTAGRLAADRVIHTVGPIYGLNDGRDEELLAECYFNCLALAAEHSLASISFPSISTGAYGFPKKEAAAISSGAISQFFDHGRIVERVRLVFFSEPDADLFTSNHRF